MLEDHPDPEAEEPELRARRVDQPETKPRRSVQAPQAGRGFIESAASDAEWMIRTVIPVIRPTCARCSCWTAGFATSDLKRSVPPRHQTATTASSACSSSMRPTSSCAMKRMLQEAVDALVRQRPPPPVPSPAANRPLKSLTDMIKGKQGRFRQNLSASASTTPAVRSSSSAPSSKLHQCGLPKKMALELFQAVHHPQAQGAPHSLHDQGGQAHGRASPKSRVWDILEEVIREHPVC